MQLRRWQSECLPICLQSLADNKRGVVQAVTGAGKAIVIAILCRDLLAADPLQSIVVTAPSVLLVEQLAKTVRSIVGESRVGLFYTRSKQADRAITIACNDSVATLATVNTQANREVAVWIADEMHSTQAGKEDFDAEDAALDSLRPRRRLGFTATPFLSGKGKLSLFDEVVYRLTPAQALRDKIIVPWRFVGWHGDETSIDDACVQMIVGQGNGPGVVNASTIADAEAFAALLVQHGVAAEAVHSKAKGADGKPSGIDAAMSRLERGEIRVVVHVNKLTVGTDYPFLRWGCFRRDVDSRVRFAQELGRFVRVAPGKTEAVIFDPHDLAGRFGMNDEAALGFEAPKVRLPEDIFLEERAAIKSAGTPEQLHTAQTAALTRYVRDLYQSLAIEGVPLPAKRVPAGPWRSEPASDGQVRSLVRMQPLSKRLPAEHADTVRRIVAVPDLVSKGIASDATDLLRALAKHGPFTPAIPIAIPPPEAFTPPVIRTLHVALVLSKTHTAGVILRGRELVWSNVRERRVEPSADGPADSFMDLSERLFTYAVRNMKPTDAEVVGSHQGAVVRAIRKFPRTPFRVVGEKENPAVARCWKMIGGAKRT